MVKSLLNLIRKPKSGSEPLTQLDVGRVFGASQPAPARAISTERRSTGVDLDAWKQKDLDLLQSAWEASCAAPDDDALANEFRTALHNLHGASGAYGGGALTRLSGSLHRLVSGLDSLHAETALINLHVQACRATAHGGGEAAEDMADAVCDALEAQVQARLRDEDSEAA